MCLPLPEDDPVIAHEAPRALHHACAVLLLIAMIALTNHLRPDTTFSPGLPIAEFVLTPPDFGYTPAHPTRRPR